MNVFISGGCKNGKSYYAQQCAKKLATELNCPLYYIATMIPHDEEDEKRIKKHIADRDGWGFITIEQGKDICTCLERVDTKGVFLFDSVTALLANEMFDEDINLEAVDKVMSDLLYFAKETGNTFFVSDYIYGNGGKYDEITETYRRGLAKIDISLAKACDEVVEIAFGTVVKHKEEKK